MIKKDDVKSFFPNPKHTQKTTREDARKFELFEILPKSERLKKFREEFIRTINKPLLFKVISNTPYWFISNKSYKKGSFFEFGLVPLAIQDESVIKTFINHCPGKDEVKHVKIDNKHYFLYTPGTIVKRGRTFTTLPALVINEDVFNLVKIQNRDFKSVTLDDLQRYSSFFEVKDEPYTTIYESRLEDLYRTGDLTLQQYKETILRYEREETLIRTLRQKNQ